MVLNTSFNELVFENRHKDYGAYQIRKRYSRNVLLAGFFAVTIFSLALGSYFINMPESHAIVIAPPVDPNDTIPMIIGDPKTQERPKLKDPKPAPPKGSPNTITDNIVIVKDSASVVNTSDSVGVTNSLTNGPGKVIDSGSVAVTGGPCLDCPDTTTIRRVAWLPNPPKDPGLDDFFRKNIKYPQLAKDQDIEGVVYLTFVVDTKGDVREIAILRGAHPLLDKEVLRVARIMPKWDPVKDDSGELVEYQYSKPVRFTLAK